MTVSTMSEVEQAISELADIDKNKAIRAGLRSAGNYLLKQGRVRLAQRNYKGYASATGKSVIERKALATHNLFNAFRVRVKKRSLGALVGFSSKGHHAHLVDRGTKKRPHPLYGTSGVMPASKFWTDTAEQDWKGAMGILVDRVRIVVQGIEMRRG